MEISRASRVVPVVKNLLANAGDTSDAGSIPGLEDPLEEGMAIHSVFLPGENPMDRGMWWATVHRFAKSHT